MNALHHLIVSAPIKQEFGVSPPNTGEVKIPEKSDTGLYDCYAESTEWGMSSLTWDS